MRTVVAVLLPFALCAAQIPQLLVLQPTYVTQDMPVNFPNFGSPSSYENNRVEAPAPAPIEEPHKVVLETEPAGLSSASETAEQEETPQVVPGLFHSHIESPWTRKTAENYTKLSTRLGDVFCSLVSDKKINRCLGIPYVLPPVGDRRFAPPEPHPGWHGSVFDARSIPKGCPQKCEMTDLCPTIVDEDCLYVNIWAPSKTTELLPVHVFIHPGAYIFGSGYTHFFDNEDIGKNFVFVTFNFRIGALGFLSANETETINGTLTGNLGFLDQQLLLRWIRDNIDAFGGNPHQVTLSGYSAGGSSVFAHLTTPSSKGLFHQAFPRSTGFLPMRVAGSRDSTNLAKGLAAHLNCTVNEKIDVSCMKRVSWADMIEAQSQVYKLVMTNMDSELFLGLIMPFAPEIGGPIIGDPIELFSQGKSHKMPMTVGFLKHEGSGLMRKIDHPLANHIIPGQGEDDLSYHSYLAIILRIFGSKGSKVLVNYPGNAFSSRETTLAAGDLITDLVFKCPLYHMTLQASWNEKTNFLYRYDHGMNTSEFINWGLEYERYCDGRACHVSDLMLSSGPSLVESKMASATDEHLKFSEDIMKYFDGFITTGTPSAPGLSSWEPTPTRSAPTDPVRLFRMDTGDEGMKMIDADIHDCLLWEEIGFRF